MKLTSENVTAVFRDCLWADADLEGVATEDMVVKSLVARGIVTNVGFNPEKVKSHEKDISTLLDELPESFTQGMSFLGACENKTGEQWTGDHAVMEQLFLLGMASGRVKECAPRDMWSVLPGGMPYYMVVPPTDGQGG